MNEEWLVSYILSTGYKYDKCIKCIKKQIGLLSFKLFFVRYIEQLDSSICFLKGNFTSGVAGSSRC